MYPDGISKNTFLIKLIGKLKEIVKSQKIESDCQKSLNQFNSDTKELLDTYQKLKNESKKGMLRIKRFSNYVMKLAECQIKNHEIA